MMYSTRWTDESHMIQSIRFVWFHGNLTGFHWQTTTFGEQNDETMTPSAPSPLSASFAWDWRHPSLRLRQAGKCQSSETQQQPDANGEFRNLKEGWRILWFFNDLRLMKHQSGRSCLKSLSESFYKHTQHRASKSISEAGVLRRLWPFSLLSPGSGSILFYSNNEKYDLEFRSWLHNGTSINQIPCLDSKKMLCALSSTLPSLSVQLGCPLQQGACIFHPGAPRTAPRAEPTQQDLCHKCGSQGFYSTHCTQNRNQSSTLNGTLRSDRGTKFLSYVEVRTLIYS